MEDTGAAIARRRIGRILVRLREAARTPDGVRVTVEAVADHLERSRPTIYRIEHGLPGVLIKNRDLDDLCTLYGAADADRKALKELVAVTKIKGWFHPYGDVLPPGFDTYLGLEEVAESISAFETDRIIGILQTDEYAREILGFPGADGRIREDAEIERRAKVRLRRQKILTRTAPSPARLEWLVNEAAIRTPAGGPAAMARQLDHINQIGNLPNVTVRVVPMSAGLHQGAVSGAFSLLRFADLEPPTVFADGFTGHLMMSDPAVVQRFVVVLAGIRDRALTETQSRAMIRAAAKEFTNA